MAASTDDDAILWAVGASGPGKEIGRIPKGGTAHIPVILMAIRLLPKDTRPLEAIAQPDSKGASISSFMKTVPALALALFIVLPATLAGGYASILFPVFSADLGLTKADINNIFVVGQLVVFISIGNIDRIEGRRGRWPTSTVAIALLGLVFLLFSINSTLAWSTVVVALVGLFGKASDGWKGMWLEAANRVDVATGGAASAMFATRSLALIAQPFILGALLELASGYAVLIIGLFCAIAALLFFLITRNSPWQKAIRGVRPKAPRASSRNSSADQSKIPLMGSTGHEPSSRAPELSTRLIERCRF